MTEFTRALINNIDPFTIDGVAIYYLTSDRSAYLCPPYALNSNGTIKTSRRAPVDVISVELTELNLINVYRL